MTDLLFPTVQKHYLKVSDMLFVTDLLTVNS